MLPVVSFMHEETVLLEAGATNTSHKDISSTQKPRNVFQSSRSGAVISSGDASSQETALSSQRLLSELVR